MFFRIIDKTHILLLCIYILHLRSQTVTMCNHSAGNSAKIDRSIQERTEVTLDQCDNRHLTEGIYHVRKFDHSPEHINNINNINNTTKTKTKYQFYSNIHQKLCQSQT
jgi:hypothetical protein